MSKGIATSLFESATDGAVRILAVVTLDSTLDAINRLMATAIAVLTVTQIVIKIRKEMRDK